MFKGSIQNGSNVITFTKNYTIIITFMTNVTLKVKVKFTFLNSTKTFR